MNKKDLINEVVSTFKGKYSKSTISDVLNEIFNTIKQSVIKGEKVKIVRFFTIFTLLKAAKMGRNPKTNEKIKVPETTVTKIKVSKSFLKKKKKVRATTKSTKN